jgi:hypothetical protein
LAAGIVKISPRASNAARFPPGESPRVPNHGAYLFKLRPGPRQIAGYFDVQLLRLTGFDIDQMNISGLFVNHRVGARRSGHDVKVFVVSELGNLLPPSL